jgi:hypothetical protein
MGVHRKNAASDLDAVAAFLANGKTTKIAEGRSYAADLEAEDNEIAHERRVEAYHIDRAWMTLSEALDTGNRAYSRRRNQ